MKRIAFCFPGQGSLARGMGREIARAVPEAMAVFDRGSEACGLDLRRLCFDTPLEEMVETEVQQPALVATSLAMLAALRSRGIGADYVIGHSVGEFAALEHRHRLRNRPGDVPSHPPLQRALTREAERDLAHLGSPLRKGARGGNLGFPHAEIAILLMRPSRA